MYGSVVELVDAPHSKCGTFGFVGSSPTAPTSLMGTYNRIPLKLIRGKGCWVWDDSGKKYLDAVAGIATCTLGHSDKSLKQELIKQLDKVQHISNLYEISEQEELADWLVKNSAADKVFFCNSGAEANEAAIKLARKYGHEKRNIDKPIILSTYDSFHGRTLAAISATGQPKYHKGFEPLVDGFKFFKYNDIKSFENLVNTLEKISPSIAAVIIEPLQGEGGINQGDQFFFLKVREICDKFQILLILDEVQTGMGRTGELWGYENLLIEPDVFTIAKGLGGGHAIGALLAKDKVSIFEPGDHASTFGGNPFACKAGLTVANEIERRNLVLNVKERGVQLKEGLNMILKKNPKIFQEVRGIGLIQGLVIRDEVNLTAQNIVEASISKKLLVLSAGIKVIRLVPALTINRTEVRQLISRLDQSIDCILKK